MDANVSPVTTRWMLRAAMDPDVGFCLPFSCGISCRVTVHSARMGVPSGVNRVYFALTWVTYAGKLLMPPHWNTTSGGTGFSLAWVLSVGVQQPNSLSTASTTDPSCLAVASKNISRVSWPGSGPLNSGGGAALFPVVGLLSHLTFLAMVNSLGLNWNSMLPISPSSLRPPVAGEDSYMISLARSTFCGALSPVGDGWVSWPPPPDSEEPITHRPAECRGGPPRASRWPPSGSPG